MASLEESWAVFVAELFLQHKEAGYDRRDRRSMMFTKVKAKIADLMHAAHLPTNRSGNLSLPTVILLPHISHYQVQTSVRPAPPRCHTRIGLPYQWQPHQDVSRCETPDAFHLINLAWDVKSEAFSF